MGPKNMELEFIRRTQEKMNTQNLSVSELPEQELYRYLYYCTKHGAEENEAELSTAISIMRRAIAAYGDPNGQTKLAYAMQDVLGFLRSLDTID